jgi:hypothetical protein
MSARLCDNDGDGDDDDDDGDYDDNDDGDEEAKEVAKEVAKEEAKEEAMEEDGDDGQTTPPPGMTGLRRAQTRSCSQPPPFFFYYFPFLSAAAAVSLPLPLARTLSTSSSRSLAQASPVRLSQNPFLVNAVTVALLLCAGNISARPVTIDLQNIGARGESSDLSISYPIWRAAPGNARAIEEARGDALHLAPLLLPSSSRAPFFFSFIWSL